jgi:hypothetical protein
MDDKSDWVWLEHPETHGKALFAPSAAPLWRGMGWVDTDPLPEPNVLKDPIPASELVPINEPVEAPTASGTTMKPAAAGNTTKETSRG